MKKYLFVIFIPVVFAACSKSKNDNIQPVPPAAAKVKTENTGVNTKTYTYDAQGRQVKSESFSGSRWEYEYSPGNVTYKWFNNAGEHKNTYVEELNEQGFSKRTINVNSPALEDQYIYNADNSLAKMITKSNNMITGIFDSFWSNGNLDSVRILNGNGVWNYTTVNTYYNDKKNVLGDDAFGLALWGKNSKNLIKTSVIKFSDGTASTLVSYTYEFDAQGRVTKRTETGNNTWVTHFTY
jgi:hypothetical protein